MGSLFLFSMQGILEVLPALETGQQRQAVEGLLIGFVKQFLLNCLHQLSQCDSLLFHNIFCLRLQNYNFFRNFAPKFEKIARNL